jgi:VCBS repeat-containing protein
MSTSTHSKLEYFGRTIFSATRLCIATSLFSGCVLDATYSVANLKKRMHVVDTPAITIIDNIDSVAGLVSLAENAAGIPIMINGKDGLNYTLTCVSNCNIVSGGTGTLPLSTSSAPIIRATSDGLLQVSVSTSDSTGGTSTIAGTSSSTADLSPPVITSFEKSGVVINGLLNTADANANLAVATLVASDFTTDDFAITNSTTSCDVNITYNISNIPTANNAAFVDGGTYKVCVRLSDAAGNITYGGSTDIAVNLVAPTTTLVTAGDTSKTLPEDAGATAIVLGSYTLGSAIQYVTITPPAKGTLGSYPSVPSSGTANVNYTPTANLNGADSFTYKVCDSATSLNCAANVTVSITITAVNDAPTMAAISTPQTTNEDTTKAIAFNIDDVDAPLTCSGANLTYTSDTPTLVLNNGSAVAWSGIYPSCTGTITPVANANGSANITFTVSDGALTAARTFTLSITATSDAPTVSDVANQSTNEDTALNGVAVAISAPDITAVCGTALSASSSNTGLLPNENISIGGTATNCTVSTNPAANQSGTATVTLTVSDGTLSAQDTFVLTVNAVNDVPITVAAGDTAITTNEDTASALLLASATDADNLQGELSYVQVTGPSKGSLSVLPAVPATGTASITYTPNANEYGTDSFVYKICDNASTPACGSNITVSISITTVNDAPVLASITAGAIAEDAGARTTTSSDLSGTLSATDVEGDTLVYSVAGGVLNGSEYFAAGAYGNLVLNKNTGAYTYYPYAGTIEAIGATNPTESLSISASDGLLSSSQTFTVNITGSASEPAALGTQTASVVSTGSEVTSTPVVFRITRTGSTASAATVYYRFTKYGSFNFTYPIGAGCETGLCSATINSGATTVDITVPISSDGARGNTDVSTRLALGPVQSALYTEEIKTYAVVAESTADTFPIPTLTYYYPDVIAYRRSTDFNATGSQVITKSNSHFSAYTFIQDIAVGSTAVSGTDFSFIQTLPYTTSYAGSNGTSANSLFPAIKGGTGFLTEVNFGLTLASGTNTVANTTQTFSIMPYSAAGSTFDGSARSTPFFVYGSDGPDVITGGSVASGIYGGPGDDRLFAGTGTTVVYGDAGNDLLVSSPATTNMYGGTEADTFVFPAIQQNARISDFTPTAGDRIALPTLPTELWKWIKLDPSKGAPAYAPRQASVLAEVFADKDLITPGNQPLQAGEAVVFHSTQQVFTDIYQCYA